MRPGRTLATRVVVITLVGSALTGCGGGPASHSTRNAAGDPDGSSVAAVDPACDSVETLFDRLQVDAAGWSPQLRPFDQAMAVRVRNLARELSTQRGKAHDSGVRAELARNVRALDELGSSMEGGKNPARVVRSVAQMRAAYAPLKGVCRINGAVPAKSRTAPEAARSKVPTTRSSAAGPACHAAQRVFARMAKVSASWSPQRHPFDPVTARRTRALGEELASLAATARSARVRTQLRSSAATLEGISAAIDSRRRNKVYDALGEAQLAYGRLGTICSLDE